MNQLQHKTLPVFAFFVLLCLTLVSQAQNEISQYGHQSGWQVPIKIETQSAPRIAWSVEVGDGRAQVVANDNKLFVASATNRTLEDKSVELTEKLEAIDAETGRVIWKSVEVSKMLKGQENFSGTPASPQATPLVVGQQVIWIGFTGIMQCVEAETGKVIWKKDLVQAFGAKPVQFGFAASPVVDPQLPDRFFVIAAGENGGLLCLKLENAEPIWRAPCETFSYATPTFAAFGGVPQILVVSEDNVIGIARDDGRQLWSKGLVEGGLTNVPSPLVLDTERFLISGQGTKGVRCLKVTKSDSEWAIDELWYLPRVTFFYQNWLKLEENLVIGCTDKFLAVIDTQNGTMIGQWRGIADANLLSADGGLLALTGTGNLKLLRVTMESGVPAGLENWGEFEVMKKRCWTPLSVVNDRLIMRAGTQLICLTLSAEANDNAGPEALANKLEEPKSLKFDGGTDK
ncbi:MAG: PQQ-binding-like beta-propeller repeat protein [Pirellulaceae bacterium]